MLKPNEKHFLGNINQKALIEKDGKFLLIQYGEERNDKASLKWDLPGGRLNEDESVQEGFEREIFEEIGVKVQTEKIIATVTMTNLSGHPNFFLIYSATLIDPEASFVLEKDEVGKIAWVSPAEFFKLDMLYPEYLEALKSTLA